MARDPKDLVPPWMKAAIRRADPSRDPGSMAYFTRPFIQEQRERRAWLTLAQGWLTFTPAGWIRLS